MPEVVVTGDYSYGHYTWKQTQKRFKEYDGTYFGHFIQWIFLFFFYIGMFAAFSLVGV